MFNSEAEFEAALIKKLTDECGWDKKILRNYSEKDLIKNWADILFQNNRQIDRLNDYPLTEGEMGQILEQIKSLRTPVKLNGFINGGSILIKRDNEDDKAHFGKEISLKIYDRKEIAAGKSRYQIVEQPQFPVHSDIKSQRRGDLLLLINGMPVIHIELKNTNVPVSQACYQIQKYAGEGIYTGIYSLVQIFVAMNPEETRYFANPGPEGKFNPDFYFHWADFNNNPINDWKRIATSFLSIPMAHQLIGFYTVADDTDGVLKVMRSYQYYAANAISDRVSKTKWDEPRQRGGYVWHTTGSGKTLTSFKSAQLIAASRDADKVIFLMDRIELGTQSLREYQGFAADDESIQATENTTDLLHKLRSDSANDTLIVTSIQKMSRISKDADIPDFSHLPDEIPVKQKFAKLFKQMNEYIEAAELQGFTWDKRSYLIEPEAGEEAEGDTGEETVIDVQLDERDFKTMAQRYKELAPTKEETEAAGSDLPYEIDGYLTTIDTEMIDSEYMNSRFEKWIKELNLSGPNAEITKKAEAELHNSFASLSQDEQKYANIFLHDIQRGDVKVEPGKSLRDYITEYMVRADSDRIHRFSETFGLDEEKLRGLKEMTLTEGNINEYGRFDALKDTVDKARAKDYFEKHEGRRLPPPKVTMKIDTALREFILDDKCDLDLEEPEE